MCPDRDDHYLEEDDVISMTSQHDNCTHVTRPMYSLPQQQPKDTAPGVTPFYQRSRPAFKLQNFNYDSWAANDVTTGPADQYFPTIIERPITRGHYRLPQALAHSCRPDPFISTKLWRHQEHREYFVDVVRPVEPRRRRLLPPLPSDLTHYHNPRLNAAAVFRQKPTSIESEYELDDDSISV